MTPRKKIVTYFKYPLMNVHLHKDVGQVLKTLARLTSLDPVLVGFRSDWIQDLQGITIHFLSRVFPGIRDLSWSFMKFILRLRSDIAILQLYFMSADSLFYAWLFKKLNPHGKVYLKLDAGPDHVPAMPVSGFWSRKFLSEVDLISAESHNTLRALLGRAPWLSEKLVYVPNGLDMNSIQATHPEFLRFDQKENRVLVLARVGLPEKNHEFLLRLLPKLDLRGWKWVFVGPIQPGFQKVIHHFFTENPTLRDQVEFVGSIEDRARLYAEIDRAKIGVSCSVREGFPLALLESLVFGQYLFVSSAIDVASMLCREGRSGSVLSVEDEALWIQSWDRVTTDHSFLKSRSAETQAWALENLSWEKALAPVVERLLR